MGKLSASAGVAAARLHPGHAACARDLKERLGCGNAGAVRRDSVRVPWGVIGMLPPRTFGQNVRSSPSYRLVWSVKPMPRQPARGGRRYPSLVVLACLLVLTPLLLGDLGRPAAVGAASNLPPGFSEEKVTTAMAYQATVFAFVPDGRILIAEKPGIIRVYKGGAIVPTPFLDITGRVNQYVDRGLLGLAIDPDFASGKPYIYVAYTYDPVPDLARRNNDGRKTAHVSRFTVSGDAADPASERILLGTVTPPSGSCNDAPINTDCLPSDGLSHTIGSIKFASDGSLFLSIGESGDFTQVNNDALRAQNIDSLAGKVLRVNADGTGRSGNPFWNGDATASRSKVWAYGLRNPFRFNLRPGTDIPYLGDVGWGLAEEINVILPGRNYGWPCYEGADQQPNYAAVGPCQQLYSRGVGAVHQPLVTWGHPDGTGSAVGGTFYTGTNYPAQYQGLYFYGDYSQGFIRTLGVDGNQNLIPNSIADFATNVAGPVDIEMGPDGDLYYLSIVTGDLYRIIYGAAATPKPQTTGYLSDMQPISSSNGLGPVELDRSNGGQAQGDGGALRVQGIEYAKGLGMYAPAQVTYALGSGCDVFTAQVGIDDRLIQNGGSVDFQVWSGNDLLYDSDTVYYTEQPHLVRVNVSGRSELRLVATTAGDDQYGDYADWLNARCDPKGAPVVTIDAPTARTYRVGDTVAYSGSAVDPAGGPAPTLAWQLITRHCPGGPCHAHPATLPGGSGTFVVNDHDDFTHLELLLTATGSTGVATTQTVAMYPQQALLTADTAPGGLNLVYGSQSAAPTVVQQIDIGGTRSLSAPTPQTLDGVTYAFTGWSDGNPNAQRTVTMTEGGQNLSALYAPVAASGTMPLTIGTAGPGAGDVLRGNARGAGTFPYPTGSGIAVRPAPAAGNIFVGWTVDGRAVGSASPLSVTMSAPHTLVANFAPRQVFADATPDRTGATEAIAQLAVRGVIKGCDPAVGLFCPTDPTLRAQMAVLIVRAMGWGAEHPANPFSDRAGVDDELWQATAIMAAHKVANGYGDGTFGTTGPVLNAQVISFITRAMVNQGYWQTRPDDPLVYANVPASSGHRQDLVTYAYYAGSVRGTAGTAARFDGWDAPASRAWFAYTFWQALGSYFGVDRPGVGGYVP